ncbi:phage tailspike protein [Sodalis sp. RH22]|uniref:phage tailspike protein n=1 Tax=unclassified Sodalis (in: enterobacteria) TaxID=2636512 RepID=UPI0039B514AB
MTIPNIVVSMPSQLFTLANSFQACANGSVYVGQIDTDPTVAANQIQVYVESAEGTYTAVAQPININAGGYPVYAGQVAKFVTVEGQSMTVLDADGVQQFYFPNVLKYDPDQFKDQLLDTAAAGWIGYDITNTYPQKTIGNKLSHTITPYDFGAIGNGVTDDTAAIQAWLDFCSSIGGGYFNTSSGTFLITQQLSINRTAVSNVIDHVLDFSGARILVDAGTLIAQYIAGSAVTFSGWSLTGNVELTSTGGLSWGAASASQGMARIILTGLTVGKTYKVMADIKGYDVAVSAGSFAMYIDEIGRITRAWKGNGVPRGEFIATATTHTLRLQSDSTDPLWQGLVYKVDVRESVYGLRLYQTGTAAMHAHFEVRGLRMENRTNSAAAGGLRMDDCGAAKFHNCSFIDFSNGEGILTNNKLFWSENNAFYNIAYVNCRFAHRYGRTIGLGAQSSFARQFEQNMFIADIEYALYFEESTSQYDSKWTEIHGNTTVKLKAILHIEGDQNNTVIEGIRTEKGGASHEDGNGIIEYAQNDLSRPWIGSIGSSVNIPTYRLGSMNAGRTWMERPQTAFDLTRDRTVVQSLRYSTAQINGVTFGYEWHEVITNAINGTVYDISDGGDIIITHGVAEIIITTRAVDGSAFEGSKYMCVLGKRGVDGSVSTPDTVLCDHRNSGTGIFVTWPANSSPRVAVTGVSSPFAIAINIRIFN